MMSAPVGSTFAVAGSSSAIVSAGPTPGSTPIAVPSVTTTNPHTRLTGVSATAKPASNAEKVSMSEHAFERALGQVEAQPPRENQEDHDGEDDRDDRAADRAFAAEAPRHEHEQQDRREDESGPAD